MGEGLSDESVWVPDEQLGGALLGNVMVGGGGGGGADSAWCPSTPSGHGKLAGSEGVVLGAEGAKGGDEGPNKGGGSPDAGGGKQLQLISKIAALMTHQLSSRYQKWVYRIVACCMCTWGLLPGMQARLHRHLGKQSVADMPT